MPFANAGRRRTAHSASDGNEGLSVALRLDHPAPPHHLHQPVGHETHVRQHRHGDSRPDQQRLGGCREAGRMQSQGRLHGADQAGQDLIACGIPPDWLYPLHRERLIADAFIGPARQLNRRAFGPTFRASGGPPEPIAGGVLAEENDEWRQRHRDVVEARRAVAVEPYPALAFAELS